MAGAIKSITLLVACHRSEIFMTVTYPDSTHRLIWAALPSYSLPTLQTTPDTIPRCFLFIQGENGAIYIYYMAISRKLPSSNVFLLWSKGKIVNRQELINDSTNKQELNRVIKQHLTDFVIEYNAEVSE